MKLRGLYAVTPESADLVDRAARAARRRPPRCSVTPLQQAGAMQAEAPKCCRLARRPWRAMIVNATSSLALESAATARTSGATTASSRRRATAPSATRLLGASC